MDIWCQVRLSSYLLAYLVLQIYPVATYISEDIQSATLQEFLQRVKRKVEARAAEIVAGVFCLSQ
jgi:hypothetical protein